MGSIVGSMAIDIAFASCWYSYRGGHEGDSVGGSKKDFFRLIIPVFKNFRFLLKLVMNFIIISADACIVMSSIIETMVSDFFSEIEKSVVEIIIISMRTRQAASEAIISPWWRPFLATPSVKRIFLSFMSEKNNFESLPYIKYM